MTRKQALHHARRVLAKHNIDDAVLESELLLRHTLNISRVQLYLDLNHELNPEQEKTLWHLVRRRLNGEPTAYITGHHEFYGLDFHVDPRVLIPRPESELLVEKAVNLAQNHPAAAIADIGTGSGAIAICLALNLPQAKIYATDTSASALEVALLNCQKHGVADRVCLLHGDMLAPLPEPVDIIVANLPYVKESELIATLFEPRLALNGGPDGLEMIRQLCRQLDDKLQPEGYLVLEIGQGQATAVSSLLHHRFPSARIEITPDLSGIDRVVTLTLATMMAENLSR
jgi:release factor glutamine methyltransferase